MDKIKILIAGCGNMGSSHAKSYHQMKEFEICGLVSRGESKVTLNKELGNAYPLFENFEHALHETNPDAVCISTYPDTHESMAIKALEKGCHIFIEKPLADTVIGSERIVEAAKKANKKVVVGYILRHHPSWERFILESQKLGKPLVMRMNLNQQSHGYMWDVHRNLMQSLSPIVDCGVHYIDVMCQMTRSKPVAVSAIGARLTEEIPIDNYNYGQLQIRFEDGSVGWYEAGWGPMVSDNAFFIKDVFWLRLATLIGCSLLFVYYSHIAIPQGVISNLLVLLINAYFLLRFASARRKAQLAASKNDLATAKLTTQTE